MIIKNPYKQRPIRFLEIYQHNDWQIKIYSISIHNEFVKKGNIDIVKTYLSEWLQQADNYSLNTYNISTLIIHEYKNGCYAIINWWIDENMLQQFVYLATTDSPSEFILYSDKGIITCVWEMAVLWFERNNWVENVLMKAPNPDLKKYLEQQYNADV
ncbi:MAG: hypothetical protein WDN26_23795 [Chitinophagaceae bacterium]